MNASADYLNEFAFYNPQIGYCCHQEMGPGLLEGVYQPCMVLELRNQDWS